MKINPAAACGAYKAMERAAASHQAAQARPADAAQGSEHTDQIEISSAGSRQLEIDKVSQSILSEIREPASPERLESLKQAVQNKTYHVPTADLADAVMKHWFGA